MAKRKRNKASKKKDAQEMAEDEQDLDRFAGSSAEEDNHDDDDEENELSHHDDDDEEVAMKSPEKSGYEAPADDEDESSGEDDSTEHPPHKAAAANTKQDDSDDNDDNSSSDEDNEDEGPRSAGLANAMARILGTTAAKGTKPLVLSKTTTRIQKQAAQQREQAKEMKEKRLLNRERELQALHIPLSVATSHQVSKKSQALVQELEMERTHRRVATRGVVALFNAIAQHQNQAAKEKDAALLSTSTSSSKTADVRKMTKHGFLDMIKQKATQDKPSKGGVNDEPQWKALQDDYMLNPKKNWDQESSDDENDEQDGDRAPKKKRKTAAT